MPNHSVASRPVIHRSRGYPTSSSRLVLSHPLFKVRLEVHSSSSKPFRRQIALEMFKLVKPVLRQYTRSWIEHRDSDVMARLWAEQRGIPSLRRASQDLEAPGLTLRLRRLELGLTLRDLAKIAQLDFGQISKIERGKIKPHPKTLARLHRALFPPCWHESPTNAKMEKGAEEEHSTPKPKVESLEDERASDPNHSWEHLWDL